MANILPFPTKPVDEDHAWPTLKAIIDDHVQHLGGPAEFGPAVADRIEDDVLRWLDLVRKAFQAIRDTKTREGVLTFFGEAVAFRIADEVRLMGGEK